jgi:DNA-binding IscR family transcriptional regulator
MSLRDKLIRDMPKRKTALCAADVAKRYSVDRDTAGRVLQDMHKDGLITLERGGNTYYYRWKG